MKNIELLMRLFLVVFLDVKFVNTFQTNTEYFNLFSGTPGNVPGLSLMPIRLYPGRFPFSS
jgi:hypothetical protein